MTAGCQGRTGSFLLWFGVLGGPIAWLLHLVVSYGLATIFCTPGQIMWLHGVTVVTALVALSAALIGWRLRGRPVQEDEATLNTPGPSRFRFLAHFAFYSGLLFLGTILAQGAPNFFLDPCAHLAALPTLMNS